ncbi:MAG: EFR1 family ferrodoxin [Promethearchaeota archaeon]
MTIIIVFLSPNGTTGEIGNLISKQFMNSGLNVKIIDLFGRTIENDIKIAANIKEHLDLLIIGSPVYASHPPKPIMAFLKHLPKQEKPATSFIYVTYGGVSAGSAIKDIAKILKKKNISLIRALKLLTHHSLIFDEDMDRFKDRPGTVEFNLVQSNIKDLIKSLKKGNQLSNEFKEININSLPPRGIKGKIMTRMISTRFISDPKHHANKCTACGVCVDKCPVKNLSLLKDNTMVKGKDCIKCFNCIRYCPNGAWTSPFLNFFIPFHEREASKLDLNKASKAY